MTTINAKIIADSISPAGIRLTTLQLRYPRFIHSEFMTHRTFCISGDAVIDFDLPKGSRGTRRAHSMTIREFAEKWFFGAARHTSSRFNGKRLGHLETKKIYTAEQVASELGLKGHLNLNAACRNGDVPAASKVDGRWVALGMDWATWREEAGYRRFSIRKRLQNMRIRQYNEKTGAIVTSTVKNVITAGSKKVFRLEAGDYSVSATEDHRILTADGWKRLGDIVQGVDHVITYAYGAGANEDPNRYNKIGGRWVQTWIRQIRLDVASRQGWWCAETGKQLDRSFHVHHVLPRHERPDLAFDINNVVAVTPEAHAALHEKQGWQVGVPLQAAPRLVESITEESVTETYDLEIDGEFANFFADGIVVHNSRNASSSRAIPVERLIQDIIDDTAMPMFWGANQKGMQAGAECNEMVEFQEFDEPSSLDWHGREEAWIYARDEAVKVARAFSQAGYHKQIVNRLLEPFAHINVVCTATDWANFFHLRDHPDAEPHIALLAREMRAAMNASSPDNLDIDDWHLPYVLDTDWDEIWTRVPWESSIALDLARKISVARCASVSYKTVDGQPMTVERATDLYEKLVVSSPLHASPCEHQAAPDEWGSIDYGRKEGWFNPNQHGNLRGWRQLRKMLPNEFVAG